MTGSSWEKSGFASWKNSDTISLKVNFSTGEASMKKNCGNYFSFEGLPLKEGKKYTFGIYVNCKGMKLKLVKFGKVSD